MAVSQWEPSAGGEVRVTPHGTIYLETRPHYCDRGRYKVLVWPAHHPRCGACAVDEADGFPRYYFDLERAKAEMQAWVEARGWDRPAEGRPPSPVGRPPDGRPPAPLGLPTNVAGLVARLREMAARIEPGEGRPFTEDWWVLSTGADELEAAVTVGRLMGTSAAHMREVLERLKDGTP